jgi:hypothetical protein
MRRRQRRRRQRRLARLVWAARLGVALVVIIGAILVIRSGNFSARSVALDDGSAWLVSSIGQAAFVDGVSAQVVTQVEVPPAGTGRGLAATQVGTDAYVSNTADGTVRRLDGATFEVSEGARLGDPEQPLAVYAGQRAIFAVSEQSGTVTAADPQTLRPLPSQGGTSPAARIPASGAVLDGAGRLWVIDGDTGRVVRASATGRHDIRGVADRARAAMVLAGEQVAVVEPGQRTVRLAGDEGLSDPVACIDTQADDDPVRVAGAVSRSQVLVASGRRGVLLVADVPNTSCRDNLSINLEAAGHELGVPREVAGLVFVPDFTAGRVLVVDVATRRLVRSVYVLPVRTEFELVPRGSFAFFNDPASERAGVVRPDGSVTQIRKYNPDDLGEGVDRGSGRGDLAGTTPPSAGPPAATPPPTQPADRSQPPTGGVRIGLSADRVAVDRPVAMRIVATGDAIVTSIQWTFGDGKNATGTRVRHAWSRPGVYPIRARTVLADNSEVVATARVTVVAEPNPPVTPIPPPSTTSRSPTPPTSPTTSPSPLNPVARLGVTPLRGTTPLTITANASDSIPGAPGVTMYTFEFGDGDGPATSGTRLTATHTYKTAGNYIVTLTVTNSAGKTAPATASVTVDLPWPRAECDPPYNPENVTKTTTAPWRVMDGERTLLTYDTESDAIDGRTLAKAYQQHCFIGRDNKRPNPENYIMEYWLPGEGSPVIANGDCRPYDREKLKIVPEAGAFTIQRAERRNFGRFASEPDANDAIMVLVHYDEYCTFGKGEYRTLWFRKTH